MSLSADDPYLIHDDDTDSNMTHDDTSRSGSDNDDAGTEVGSEHPDQDNIATGSKFLPDSGEAEINVMGTIDEPMAEGEARRSLREQLRRTLTREKELGADVGLDSDTTPTLSSKARGKQAEVIDEPSVIPLGGIYGSLFTINILG